MPRNDFWTKEEVELLIVLRKEQGLSFKEIAKKFPNKTECAVKAKYHAFDGSDPLLKPQGEVIYKQWSVEEALTLYELRTKYKLSYEEIAEKLGRNSESCKKKYHNTTWKTFIAKNKRYAKNKKNPEAIQEVLDEEYSRQLTISLMEISRYSTRRLKEITKDQFFKQTTLPSKRLPISFTELKKQALYELDQIGYSYPSYEKLSKGTYIICGDSHGKHTRTGVFNLLKKLNNHLNADAIIHIGHALDDDNDISYHWDNFDNLIILSKEEELRELAKKGIRHNVIRREISLGGLSVQNQDLIDDYVQTPLSSLTEEYYPGSTIANLHRHELDTRCTEQGASTIIASPGCLCEKHIVYTIKQQDFTDGRTVKMTYPTGYKKYRRMRTKMKTWQQGFLVVHVNGDDEFTVVQCKIEKTSKGYTTSYFDKIITEKSIINPITKTFINGDLHVKLHDCNVLDIQEQICKDYKPTDLICIGDVADNHVVNHHIHKERGTMSITDEDFLQEAAANSFVIKRMQHWAPSMTLLKGNHERFYEDFYKKFPQFKYLMDFEFLLDCENIDIVDLKTSKKMNNCTYVHGDLLMYGQKGGNKLDKLSRTYGKNTVMGHCHYPSTRMGCHSIGLTGQMDLNYNEIDASKWAHGFGLSNTYEDKAFICTIAIINNKCHLNKKVYKPKKPENWVVPYANVKLSYDYEKKD